MRFLYISFFAAIVGSQALISTSWLEGSLPGNEEIPYDIAYNPSAGTRCTVNPKKGEQLIYNGISLPRSDCYNDLSVWGQSFDIDNNAQKGLSDYMKQLQCCIIVPCYTKYAVYGYCTNTEKGCINDSHSIPGDCPTSNSICCVENKLIPLYSTDETESLTPINGGGLDWDQMGIGSNLNLDLNLDNSAGDLSFGTTGEDEDLFSTGSPGEAALDLFT